MFTDANTKVRIKVGQTFWFGPNNTLIRRGPGFTVYCGSCPTWVHPCLDRQDEAIGAAWDHVRIHQRRVT